MRPITTRQYRHLLDLYNEYLGIIQLKPESVAEARAIVEASKAVKNRIEEYTGRLGIE